MAHNANPPLQTPVFNPIRLANAIAVGGMIALGKSTLVQALAKALPFSTNVVTELDQNDLLAKLLLEKMYSRENSILYGSVFQLYFVLQRFDNYKKNCNLPTLSIFDRSIFEDWLFANQNIQKPMVFNYYDALWKDIVNELIYQHGIPRFYVILDGSWPLFEQRLFERNRPSEINHFANNKLYFENLWSLYKNYLVHVCNDFGIKHMVLDAALPLPTKVNMVMERLRSEQLVRWT